MFDTHSFATIWCITSIIQSTSLLFPSRECFLFLFFSPFFCCCFSSFEGIVFVHMDNEISFAYKNGAAELFRERASDYVCCVCYKNIFLSCPIYSISLIINTLFDIPIDMNDNWKRNLVYYKDIFAGSNIEAKDQ